MTVYCGERQVKLEAVNKFDDSSLEGTQLDGTITVRVPDRKAWDIIGTICHEILHLLDCDRGLDLTHEQIYNLSRRLEIFLAQNEGSEQNENHE